MEVGQTYRCGSGCSVDTMWAPLDSTKTPPELHFDSYSRRSTAHRLENWHGKNRKKKVEFIEFWPDCFHKVQVMTYDANWMQHEREVWNYSFNGRTRSATLDVMSSHSMCKGRFKMEVENVLIRSSSLLMNRSRRCTQNL